MHQGKACNKIVEQLPPARRGRAPDALTWLSYNACGLSYREGCCNVALVHVSPCPAPDMSSCARSNPPGGADFSGRHKAGVSMIVSDVGVSCQLAGVLGWIQKWLEVVE